MRLFAEIRELVALSLLVLLAAAPWARAESPALAADCPDETAPSAVKESTPESHRRGAEKKKAAQARLATEMSETPIERLQQLYNGDVLLQPIIVRSTLAEAMRRVALWGDCCPICGHACAAKQQAETRVPTSDGRLTKQKMLNVDAPDEKAGKQAASEPLRAGEPAQVILDTQKRLGKSVTDGTEFGGSPELLIQWIRVLDEENRRQQLALEETERSESPDEEHEEEAMNLHVQVEALRQACRQLQEAADLLEEQDLFESADSIRGFADALRRQSRHKLQELDAAGDELPARSPRHASSRR